MVSHHLMASTLRRQHGDWEVQRCQWQWFRCCCIRFTIQGFLQSRGIHVQRYHVRQSIRRVDPVYCSARWNQTITRRVYNVAGPNSLWHIDSHHSLIRWRLVMYIYMYIATQCWLLYAVSLTDTDYWIMSEGSNKLRKIRYCTWGVQLRKLRYLRGGT